MFVHPSLFAALAVALATSSAVPHPLDPLSSQEIAAAAEIVRGASDFPVGGFFPLVALAEPPKREVLAWKVGRPFRREAQVLVLDRPSGRTFEARVDLVHRKLLSFERRAGVQPLVLIEEYDTVPKLVRADPRWQAAMRKRGITDFSKVWVETWAVGSNPPDGQEGARLLRAMSFMQDGAVNVYSRPIEGVIATVNMNRGEVVDVIDTGVVPVSNTRVEFDEKSLGPVRTDLRPLLSSQPQGPSFTVNGHEVRWQKWRFRFGMHPREGLVLYDVGYEDAGKLRTVLYRASLSEMVVPYGDPDSTWAWRNAFDEGEYGVGRLAAPLEPGIDAPQTAWLFDANFADDLGKPYALKNAVGLYERDGGISWKHYDLTHDVNQSRRARELVIFFITTVGNYDYGVNWIFHQDGTIQVDCELSGIMLSKGVLATRADGHTHGQGLDHAHLVDKNIAAPHHQHFFNFRLDLDVDGTANSAWEMNSRSAPMGDHNPYGNAIVMEETPLATEKAAARDVSMANARTWRIGHAALKNSLGYSPSYLLMPSGNTVPYADPTSQVRQRARFVDHHFWVTRYQDDERHAGGWYPNQGKFSEGLPAYIANDEGLSQQDLVVWYTTGITHIPRPEEWPIMTMHHVGFKLLPAGFFLRNPALDLPRSPY